MSAPASKSASPPSVKLDDDVFDLSVVFQGVNAHFPAKPALFVASERCGGIEDIVAVHPHSTSLKSLGDFVCLVDVLRPHTGRQAINRIITAGNDRIEIFKRIPFPDSEICCAYGLWLLAVLRTGYKSKPAPVVRVKPEGPCRCPDTSLVRL